MVRFFCTGTCLLLFILVFTACKKDQDKPYSGPSNPFPADQSTGQNTMLLSWDKYYEVPLEYGYVYDVYFGTTPDPPLLAAGVGESMYNDRVGMLTGILKYSTTYYWRVVARDSTGTHPGPVWRFTTKGPETNDYRDPYCGSFRFRTIYSGADPNNPTDTTWYEGYITKVEIPDTLLFIRYHGDGPNSPTCDSVFGPYVEPAMLLSGQLQYQRFNTCMINGVFGGHFVSTDSVSFAFSYYHNPYYFFYITVEGSRTPAGR